MTLLDKNAVARTLGVSVRTIEAWVYEKRIPFIRLSHRCVRFRDVDVQKFIDERLVQAEG